MWQLLLLYYLSLLVFADYNYTISLPGPVVQEASSTSNDSAKVAAILQQPKETMSKEHVTNVDNIILTVLQKEQRQHVSHFLLN